MLSGLWQYDHGAAFGFVASAALFVRLASIR